MAASSSWDGAKVKAQLRLTAQRLGQLQDRKDSLAHITSRDIATLLRQRNVPLARAKVQNLITEDSASNALEILEMHCGVVVERFTELEKGDMKLHPSTIEAVSSIIYAAPHTESKDLSIVREMLMQRLGRDFSQSAIFNSDGHVSPTIVKCLHHTSTAAEIDEYLMRIARTFDINWKPQINPEEKTTIISEMLDESDIMGVVDISKLRSICGSGIPAHPPWLRPRVWKLLLGLTPPTKARWRTESQKRRDDYYDLVQRLLTAVANRPLPVGGLQPEDKSLLKLFDMLSSVPAYLFTNLDDEPELFENCPVHPNALEKIRLDCSSSLDSRLRLLQSGTSSQQTKPQVSVTPEIRLETGSPPTSPATDTFQASRKKSSTLLVPQAYRNIACHEHHVSALFRLLYIHRSLNPANHSPHIASLLVPLYSVMNEEAEPDELAHAEADTFWLFESLLREVSELEEEEGGTLWMKRLGQRLADADPELHEDLQRKGLDPSMPHYSYKWLAPLLAHTLPLSAVQVVWDALFAQPESYRGSNPKLEHLIDMCTAMLIRARSRLLLLGKPGRRSPSLWDDDGSGLSRSPLRAWELGDAFMEGMTILQRYPIEEAGGVERLIQVAEDIREQRVGQSKDTQAISSTTIGEKLRNTLWGGPAAKAPSNGTESSPEGSDEDAEEEDGSSGEVTDSTQGAQSVASAWASRLGTSVWRGITNQSAMDVPPSPDPEANSPAPSPRRQDSDKTVHALNMHAAGGEETSMSPPAHSRTMSSFLSPPGTASLWGYADKLIQSDMAAKLSKVSTNMSAKALNAWSARSAPPVDAPVFDQQQKNVIQSTTIGRSLSEQLGEGDRRGSLPNIIRSSLYSPPPRPAFFKPPRDSRIFSPSEASQMSFPDSPDSVTSSQSAPVQSTPSHTRVGSVSMQKLQSWSQGFGSKPVKPAPRPLLLNPSSLVTPSPTIGISRSANSTPRPDRAQWEDVLQKRIVSPRSRDSQSSVSTSLSSPRTMESGGWDSDTSVSRKVPLNRASISPVAPLSRVSRYIKSHSYSQSEKLRLARSTSEAEPGQFATMPTHAEEERRSMRGWEQIPIPDSPSTYTSSPPPRTPVSSVAQAMVEVNNTEKQRGSLVLSEPSGSGITSDLPLELQQNLRRKSSPMAVPSDDADTSDSSPPPPSPSIKPASRVRTKRYGAALANLRIRDSIAPSSVGRSHGGLSPNSLTAPELSEGADTDLATTPRAVAFPSTSPTSRRMRKVSTEGHERRQRKVSTEKLQRRARSGSEDGDDEGYDDLLSAYESEESRDDHWVDLK